MPSCAVYKHPRVRNDPVERAVLVSRGPSRAAASRRSAAAARRRLAESWSTSDNGTQGRPTMRVDATCPRTGRRDVRGRRSSQMSRPREPVLRRRGRSVDRRNFEKRASCTRFGQSRQPEPVPRVGTPLRTPLHLGRTRGCHRYRSHGKSPRWPRLGPSDILCRALSRPRFHPTWGWRLSFAAARATLPLPRRPIASASGGHWHAGRPAAGAPECGVRS